MGAEFCYVSLTYFPKQKFNWDAGIRKIRKAAKHDYETGRVNGSLDEIEDEGEYPVIGQSGMDYTSSELELALGDLKEAVVDGSRDSIEIDMNGIMVLISGGMTWGDDPTNLYTQVSKLSDCGAILEAVGFNPHIPDYPKILKKILKIEEIPPMIMGIDKDLDKMIESKLKKGEPCSSKA